MWQLTHLIKIPVNNILSDVKKKTNYSFSMVYNIHKYVNANGRIEMAGWRRTTLSKQRFSPLECVMSAGFGSLFSPACFFFFICLCYCMFNVRFESIDWKLIKYTNYVDIKWTSQRQPAVVIQNLSICHRECFCAIFQFT